MAVPSPSPAAMTDDAPSSPPPAETSFKFISPSPQPSQDRPRGKKAAQKAQDAGSQVGKIRHLKKEDGEPLWRKDIQFDFLRAVFDNDMEVFTNSYEPDRIGKQNFADLYIDTMSRSSKTSKVLRDKLLSDRDAAKGMAMVCLLVNVGRMNTTLNFFPEMRAQLRTYHAIPSLQAHQDPHAYKQLQDAPRLKSILKGGSEDRDEPNTLEGIKSRDVPRTNPVNLLFVICQSALKIAELHFPPGREFHDLVMKTNLSSQSRARAFLWLMWFYLESDFTEEGCEENPFGAGVDYGVDVANQGVPEIDEMTADEEAAENIDTQVEVDFGYAKQKMRAKIIEADQQYVVDSSSKRGARARIFPHNVAQNADDGSPSTGILPRIRPSKHESDMDSTRSTPPPRALGRGTGAFGSTSRRTGAPLKYQIFETSSPGASQVEGIVARKPRPPTAHQLAVEKNRNQRVEYILDRGIRRKHHKSRKYRRQEGSLIRAMKRLDQMNDTLDDSEGEETQAYNRSVAVGANVDKTFAFRERGAGGLVPLKNEEDDFGEEVTAYVAAIRRATRRLKRWKAHEGEPLGVIRPVKPARTNGLSNGDEDDFDGYLDDGDTMLKDDVGAETEEELPPPKRKAPRKSKAKVNGRAKVTNGDVTMDDAEDLDDVEKELLGMASGGEEDLDEVDKALLGVDDADEAMDSD